MRLPGLLLAGTLVLGLACDAEAPRSAPDRSEPTASEASGPCEHGLSEGLCTKCTPSLIPVFQSKGDWCPEHGFPESYCPICNPDAEVPDISETQRPKDDRASIEARVVRFRSEDIEASVGLETFAAQRGASAKVVDAPARIDFDADRIAEVRALVPGIIRTLRVEVGARVEAGEALVDLESTEIGQIQGALQSARERARAAEAHLQRQRDLLAEDVASKRTVEVAERELALAQADLRTAKSALRMTGARSSKPSGRYTLSAPIAGTVVRRPAIRGQHATAHESLATLADTSSMWALLDIPEADIGDVAVGQKVIVTLNGRGGDHMVEGELTWISMEVNPRTRTVIARAELPNPDGRLRANQFAQAQIEISAPTTGVRVPRASVQRVGEHEVVFVRAAPGVYTPRVVERSGEGSMVGVRGRIEAGEAVVTTGAVLLRTEIMPGSIGAGCCEVD